MSFFDGTTRFRLIKIEEGRLESGEKWSRMVILWDGQDIHDPELARLIQPAEEERQANVVLGRQESPKKWSICQLPLSME